MFDPNGLACAIDSAAPEPIDPHFGQRIVSD
jgi:hypothetical protein